MILLTVGTTSFPFNRLLKAVDQVLCNLETNEDLIIQAKNQGYKFSYPKTKVYQELPFNAFITLIIKSRLVVSHGGLATSMLCLKYAKNKPIIIPRLKVFKEHVDDHQLFFLNHLVKNNQVFGVFSNDNLEKKLKEYLTHPVKNTQEVKDNTKKLIRKLTNYLNNEKLA